MEWRVTAHFLLMLLLVISLLFICIAIHECIMFPLKGRIKVGKSSCLSKNKRRWHYQSIKVKADGMGAELICSGGGGGNPQLKTQKTGCTLTMGQCLLDSVSVRGCSQEGRPHHVNICSTSQKHNPLVRKNSQFSLSARTSSDYWDCFHFLVFSAV